MAIVKLAIDFENEDDDDYLYCQYIEEEKERKAQKRKEYISFYYKNKRKGVNSE